MRRCNPPFHPKIDADGKFIVYDVDRSLVAKGPMSARKAIEVADEMNQPFLKEKEDMELPVSNNPELLTVGLNPRRKKRRYSVKARNPRRKRGRGRRGRRRNPPTIKYRGSRYGFLKLMHKFGKGMARKIWRSARPKAIGHNPKRRRSRKGRR